MGDFGFTITFMITFMITVPQQGQRATLPTEGAFRAPDERSERPLGG